MSSRMNRRALTGTTLHPLGDATFADLDVTTTVEAPEICVAV